MGSQPNCHHHYYVYYAFLWCCSLSFIFIPSSPLPSPPGLQLPQPNSAKPHFLLVALLPVEMDLKALSYHKMDLNSQEKSFSEKE